MMKPALLFSTLLFSLNISAASIADLNTTLHQAHPKATKTATHMVYAGRDILKPEAVSETIHQTETKIG